jgi:hypothetical protein
LIMERKMGVSRLEIKSRQPFASGETFGETGPYQQIDGVVHFAVDPNQAANSVITDLNLALRDANGLVHSAADFRILLPASLQQGSHRIVFDVANRGNPTAMTNINSASGRMEPGNGFLMRHGYTVVWCGWQYDVPSTSGLMSINVPDALSGAGGPISGKITVAFQPHATIQVNMLSDRLHQPHPVSNIDDPESVLMVREHQDAPPQIIPRSEWSFARLEGGRVVPDASHVYMASGFQPGKTYEVTYKTTGAAVVGMGLLAPRDFVSFLRYGPASEDNPCAGDIRYAYAFGRSQSGSFLRQFLYQGLTQDEQDRPVFDGVFPLVAGSGRGELNQRFGQPSAGPKYSAGRLFPFHDTEQEDPDTGRTDGLLRRLAAKGKVPKIFLINTSAEYWGGHAALIHTTLDGKDDLPPSDSVRIYHYAGTQHGPGRLALYDVDIQEGPRGQQLGNSVDYRPLLRAALVNLDRWVSSGEEPPASCHPRLDDGTAIPPERTEATFRAIPGVNFPEHLKYVYKLDFGPEAYEGIVTKLPPVVGKAYPSFASAVDQDGNELAGIRLPDVSVPLATNTGWNLRHPESGGPGQIMPQTGSSIPFPARKADREASGDPRRSIEERYASKEDYLEQVRKAAQVLVDQGYLLPEDLTTVDHQAAERYLVLCGQAKDVLSGPVAAS